MSNESNNIKFRPTRDPIWGDIDISEDFREIVDSQPIQRLRYIKHGGLTFLSLPSANHSRFEHTLGTYHLIKILKEKLGMSDGLVHFALLHHIDDPPFSYATHEVIQNILKKKWNKNYPKKNKEFIENLIANIPYFKDKKDVRCKLADVLITYKEYKKPLPSESEGPLIQFMDKKPVTQYYREHPLLFITSVIDSECRNSHYMGIGKPQGIEMLLNFIKEEDKGQAFYNNLLVDKVLREIRFYAFINAVYHASVDQSRLIARLLSRILFSIYESKSHNKVWWYGNEIQLIEVLTDARKFLDFNDFVLLQIIDDLIDKKENIKNTNIYKYIEFYISAVNGTYKVFELKQEQFDASIMRIFTDIKYDDIIKIEREISKELKISTIIIDPVFRSISQGFLLSDMPLNTTYDEIEFSREINDIDEIHPELQKIKIFTLKEVSEEALKNAFSEVLSRWGSE